MVLQDIRQNGEKKDEYYIRVFIYQAFLRLIIDSSASQNETCPKHLYRVLQSVYERLSISSTPCIIYKYLPCSSTRSKHERWGTSKQYCGVLHFISYQYFPCCSQFHSISNGMSTLVFLLDCSPQWRRQSRVYACQMTSSRSSDHCKKHSFRLLFETICTIAIMCNQYGCNKL